MAKILDLNTVERPVLTVVMQDDARTRIDVSTPTESLVGELQRMAPQLAQIVQHPDEMDSRAPYDLAARLINCNRSFISVTAEELREKYRMNLESLLIFFGAYVDFIDEITKAKN